MYSNMLKFDSINVQACVVDVNIRDRNEIVWNKRNESNIDKNNKSSRESVVVAQPDTVKAQVFRFWIN